MVGITSWPLYSQGKAPWYPLHNKLREPLSRSGNTGRTISARSDWTEMPVKPHELPAQWSLLGSMARATANVICPSAYRNVTYFNYDVSSTHHRIPSDGSSTIPRQPVKKMTIEGIDKNCTCTSVSMTAGQKYRN